MSNASNLVQAVEEFSVETNKKTWGYYNLNIYGTVGDKQEVKKQTGACYARLYEMMRFWYKVEGCDNNFFSLSHGRRPKGNWLNGDYGREDNYAMHESDRSVSPWLEFILSKDSPFKEINKHLVVSDPEWISKHAIVLKDVLQIDARQLYIYLIAIRQPYEFPCENALFEHCLEKGVSPKTAAMASFYVCTEDNGKTFIQKIQDGHQAVARFGHTKIRDRWMASKPQAYVTVKNYIGDTFGLESERSFAGSSTKQGLGRFPSKMNLEVLVHELEQGK